MMTDPIADMLTRIRNAVRVERPNVTCRCRRSSAAWPKCSSAKATSGTSKKSSSEPVPQLRLRAEIWPQRRARHPAYQAASASRAGAFTAGADRLRPVLNGLGISIISTSRGVISDREARQRNLGGEVLCELW